MGIVTTHTEGRVVTHADDGQLPVEVVQLPARDAAVDTQPERPQPATTAAPLSEKSQTVTPAKPKRARKRAAKRARKARR